MQITVLHLGTENSTGKIKKVNGIQAITKATSEPLEYPGGSLSHEIDQSFRQLNIYQYCSIITQRRYGGGNRHRGWRSGPRASDPIISTCDYQLCIQIM